jgi:replicative DNA helicase
VSDDFLLPHSETREAAIVARLLVDPAQLPVLSGSLSAEDFYDPTWRAAYSAMQRLSQEHRTIDIEGLRPALGADADELARSLGELTAGHRAPVDEYARDIRGDAFKRRLVGTLQTVIAKASKVDAPVLLAELTAAVQRIGSGMEDGALLSPDQAIDFYTRESEARARGERRGLSWGLPSMDNVLLPAYGGEMVVLAARPSVGKTALAEMIADHWAHTAEYPVLFASLEMGVDSILDRTIARTADIPGGKVISGNLSKVESALAEKTLLERRGVALWYLDDPYATTSSVRAAAARVRLLAGGIGGIVIDYLQLLKDPGDQEVQRVTKISRQVKAMAREFSAPTLALSQLNRASANRDDTRPRLQDLRESGAIEQDADRVFGLWRTSLESTETEVIVLKARQGKTGTVYLDYIGEHFRFEEPGSADRGAWNAAEASVQDAVGLL